MEQDVFEESMEYNEQAADVYEIEPALLINNRERTACPGVNIEIDGQNMPVFISSEQLRRMADAADEMAEQQIKFA
ncbi:hypothetical protein [Stutzerimonas stutzeri]|uniref:hypothetical protein n=1 Tax=Stutzerimonas stutzeri TaxID=316 RepID=UPI000C9A7157|nr:hypothetical protein [Stutzerimonas stutzeri]PNG11900.1 hypothetical protein CXK97_19465 [Stutzerimonas stutzeri]